MVIGDVVPNVLYTSLFRNRIGDLRFDVDVKGHQTVATVGGLLTQHEREIPGNGESLVDAV